MKKPNLLTTLFANVSKRTKARLNAATAAARPGADAYEASEPASSFSSAFVVVLILHAVAIGGIYAFNCIKASRLSREPKPASLREPATKLPPKTTAKAPVTSEAASTTAPRVTAPAVASSAPTAGPKSGIKQHVVKAGENPTKIAFAYSVKTEDLLAANNLKDGAVLHPGDALTIPKQAAKAAAEPRKPETTPAKRVDIAPTKTTPGVHLVKKKETATSIAKIYGLSATDLLKLNKISDPTKIREGQPLTIPKRKE